MLRHTRCPRCHELLYTDRLHKTGKDCLENALRQLDNLRVALVEHERAMSFVLFGDEVEFAALNDRAGGSHAA